QEIFRLYPHAKAGSAYQYQKPDHDVGFLEPEPRKPAPGLIRHERPRHTLWLPAYAWLWQPYLQYDQSQERESVGEVPLQDGAGYKELYELRGRENERRRPRLCPAGSRRRDRRG